MVKAESKTYLFPDDEKPRKTSYQFLFVLIILFNLFSILFVTAYVAYNLWFNETLSQETSIKLDVYDDNSFSAKFLSSSLVSNDTQCSIPDDNKFDCHPDLPINKNTCEARGCCWAPKKVLVEGSLPPLDVPYCFYPNNYEGYQVVDSQSRQHGAKIKLRRKISSGFPKDIENVNVEIEGLDNERLRIRIVDADSERYEVPLPWLNVSKADKIDTPLYNFKLVDNNILQIIRNPTGTVIFQTDLRKLVYADQFIQLSSFVPSKALYGLGEHVSTFRKDLTGWKRYTMFNRDIEPSENVNLYGSYPVYMMVEDGLAKHAHGVFLLNSNAMDVITQPAPAVTWRTIGGILDFFIYMGPTVKDVTRQNINLIGRPVMQPIWTFGFHICRYGYGTLNKTKETFERNIAVGIPIETQWNDIDYMDKYNDFTVDPINYAGLKEWVNELHSQHRHYVVIIDAGVSGSEIPGTYPPYDEGVRDDIFVKNSTNQILIGKTWNLKSTVYPDYTNPATLDYWKRQFAYLRNQVEYDGAWIDMDEPSNFYNGVMVGTCPNNSYENPPYIPNGVGLATKTLCMSAKQHLGIHYNTHNIYPLYETVATNYALAQLTRKRPFIVSRASFPSLGHFGSHWSGDIRSNWDRMKYTISNMFDFNFYGIPMIGSDICGFNGNTTVELCMRWQAVGAFYPFSRNHNSDDTIEQDPAILGPKVIASTKYALNLRYRLIPYLYTLMFKAHNFADTVIRPLFYEFPEDDNTYSMESQFMWGSNLMIVPVLEPKTNTVKAYFPKGIWYDFVTSKVAINSTGQFKNLSIAEDKIGLYVRGGSLLPAYLSSANTIYDLRKQTLYLYVYLNESGQAEGDFFDDDGESLDNVEKGDYTFGRCYASSIGLVCKYDHITDKTRLGGLYIVGLKKEPRHVIYNGNPLISFFYHDENNSLKIDLPSDFKLTKFFRIQFS